MMFEHIAGVDTSMDDIIVYGETIEEHNERLRQVLEIAKDNNLKLNKKKCQYCVKELTFLGDVISEEGLKADPIKIQAIQNFERPTSKKDVQRFLAMVNYQGRYLSNLSSKSEPLRNLLVEKNEFVWGEQEENCFIELKNILSNEPILKFYDPEKEIKISSDSSKSGLGAVLLQKYDNEWCPVAYASRAMTSAEMNYAQIEKECLGITFACERFHQYIFGQPVTIETDHKPLVAIMKKPLGDCPIRIQRLLLRLQKYAIELTYIPGTFLYTSDALSRAYVKTPYKTDLDGEEEVEVYVDMVMSNMQVSDEKLESIKMETSKDGQLQILKNVILQGFPSNKSNCSREIIEYWNIRDELSYVEGLIMKGSKIIIPKTLRKQMLQKIHAGHLGIEKCRRRAREVMYWPGMYQSITDMVKSCSVCLKHQPKQPAQPLNPHPVTNYPWEKLGVDLCSLEGENYLVMCDYFSNYPEVGKLRSTSSESVISAMKYVFAGQGIPAVVFSDNGSQFSSVEFRKFAKEYEFSHETSSPTYARSNGLVESCVKRVKMLLKKSKEDGSDFYLGLLAYRSAPLECGLSPAELLKGRKIRSNLPISGKQLKLKKFDKYKKCFREKKVKQKVNFDKNTKDLANLSTGETVRIRDGGDKYWQRKGVIKEKVAPRSYIVESEAGVHYRRNRQDILKTNENLNNSSQIVVVEEYTNNGCTSQNNLESSLLDKSSSIEGLSELIEPRRSSRISKRPSRLIEEI